MAQEAENWPYFFDPRLCLFDPTATPGSTSWVDEGSPPIFLLVLTPNNFWTASCQETEFPGTGSRNRTQHLSFKSQPSWPLDPSSWPLMKYCNQSTWIASWLRNYAFNWPELYPSAKFVVSPFFHKNQPEYLSLLWRQVQISSTGS